MIKYLTGKDYPYLCRACRVAIDSVVELVSEAADEYAGDVEGPIMYVYDHRLYCGRFRCVNKPEGGETDGR